MNQAGALGDAHTVHAPQDLPLVQALAVMRFSFNASEQEKRKVFRSANTLREATGGC